MMHVLEGGGGGVEVGDGHPLLLHPLSMMSKENAEGIGSTIGKVEEVDVLVNG